MPPLLLIIYIIRRSEKELLNMFRYVHSNIIAKNAGKLIDFYKTVLHCKSINETRNLSGRG